MKRAWLINSPGTEPLVVALGSFWGLVSRVQEPGHSCSKCNSSSGQLFVRNSPSKPSQKSKILKSKVLKSKVLLTSYFLLPFLLSFHGSQLCIMVWRLAHSILVLFFLYLSLYLYLSFLSLNFLHLILPWFLSHRKAKLTQK